jgi:hypothetical protein
VGSILETVVNHFPTTLRARDEVAIHCVVHDRADQFTFHVVIGVERVARRLEPVADVVSPFPELNDEDWIVSLEERLPTFEDIDVEAFCVDFQDREFADIKVDRYVIQATDLNDLTNSLVISTVTQEAIPGPHELEKKASPLRFAIATG